MADQEHIPAQGTVVVHKDDDSGITYQSGYGNTFESETVEGALPLGRNSPRKVPLDLYAEQLSGTAFTRPRHLNQRTWLYRKQPSAVMNTRPFECTEEFFGGADPDKGVLDPNALRWMPFTNDGDGDDASGEPKDDFVSGTHLLGASGDPAQKSGIAVYVYLCQKSMMTATGNSYMYNSDGDFLILPQQGSLEIKTEMGKLMVKPGEFCVVPRGIVFAVNLVKGKDTDDNDNTTWRGYMLEVFKGHLVLPELGPIGSNGLANARDFLYPTAWTEESTDMASPARTVYNKFGSKLWSRPVDSSPFNVVAWHGNYLPYKYDLANFCA
ncbi:MAG: hypothetical protein SGILL_009365, partial [Bacillariaceae sp.]